MSRLKCPNCGKKMFFDEQDLKCLGGTYDKWICEDCTHIIVLDERYE